LQQAIALDPDYAPAYAGLAALYFNLSNYNFALIPSREAWTKAKAASKRALARTEVCNRTRSCGLHSIPCRCRRS